MTEQTTLAGGCFWCLEAVFQELKGVTAVQSGYAGGHVANPSYEQVCTGTTGHAEVVQVTFDPAVVTYGQLLEVFWAMDDPTQTDRQGPDVVDQYRSVIFTHSPDQALPATESKARAQAAFPRPIATEIEPLTATEIDKLLTTAYGAPKSIVQNAAALVEPSSRAP